jgi:hypothetical protein
MKQKRQHHALFKYFLSIFYVLYYNYVQTGVCTIYTCTHRRAKCFNNALGVYLLKFTNFGILVTEFFRLFYCNELKE